MTPEIIAHRGYSAKAPENTLAALEAAIAHGASSVEFDIQTAACGTPVLFHDPMLGRTTNGVGPLGRRPLGQLKALDAGSWFGPEFTGETVPTLEEALGSLQGRIQRVYQEIKAYREMEDIDRIVAITEKAGLAGSTVFLASDWVILNRLRQVAPEVQRGYLVASREKLLEALDRAFIDEGSLLCPEIGLAHGHPERIQEAVGAGVDLMTWTVDEPWEATRALEAGFHRIASNQVEDLLAWRDELTLEG